MDVGISAFFVTSERNPGMEAMMMNRSDRKFAAAPVRVAMVRPEPAQVFQSTAHGVSVPPTARDVTAVFE